MGRPKILGDSVGIAFRLERSTRDALQELADSREVSIAHIIREALSAYLGSSESEAQEARDKRIASLRACLIEACEALEEIR